MFILYWYEKKSDTPVKKETVYSKNKKNSIQIYHEIPYLYVKVIFFHKLKCTFIPYYQTVFAEKSKRYFF